MSCSGCGCSDAHVLPVHATSCASFCWHVDSFGGEQFYRRGNSIAVFSERFAILVGEPPPPGTTRCNGHATYKSPSKATCNEETQCDGGTYCNSYATYEYLVGAQSAATKLKASLTTCDRYVRVEYIHRYTGRQSRCT